MLLVVLVQFGSWSLAQVSPQVEQIRFSSITRANGLADHTINAIFKDSEGFMWFGTRNGLCRFDGIDFVTYRSEEDPQSISGNRILSIAEDASGFLWIGTYANGICRYDRELDEFIRYDQGYGMGNRVNRVAALNDGSLWACTNIGLAKYVAERDSFEVYYHNPSDPNSLNFPSVSCKFDAKPESTIICGLFS